MNGFYRFREGSVIQVLVHFPWSSFSFPSSLVCCVRSVSTLFRRGLSFHSLRHFDLACFFVLFFREINLERLRLIDSLAIRLDLTDTDYASMMPSTCF